MKICQPATRILACLSMVTLCAAQASAQLQPAVDYQLQPTPSAAQAAGQRAVRPALFTGLVGQVVNAGGADAMMMDAHGDSVVIPASYCESCNGGGYCDAGCYGDAALAGLGGGFGIDQCGPHYFDVSAEFLYWQRDKASDPNIPFASVGINGPRALTSESLSLDEQPGFRVVGRYDLGPLSVFEASYFGTFHYASAAGASSQNPDLFSPFTNFGLGNPPAFQGFIEADAVRFANIQLISDLHNVELNLRRYWVGYWPRLTGTVLVGARYVRLTESFDYSTLDDVGGNRSVAYNLRTENDVVGAQMGGDAWLCLLQGLRLGTETKVGIYNTRSKQAAVANSSLSGVLLDEAVNGNETSFIGEASVSLVADILPSLSLRGGYQVFYMKNVALGANNFNPVAPGNAARMTVLVDRSEVLYHGFSAGFDYIY